MDMASEDHTAPVDRATAERRLRERYSAVWSDIQRELESHHDQKYADLIEQGADPGDHAVADLLVDIGLAEIDRDVRELRAIQKALDRLYRGTYGICEQCGRSIDQARLQAAPEACRCLECQAREENRTRSTPSL